MALGEFPTLIEINTELGTSGQSEVTCIDNAGQTGVWDRQSDFAFYTFAKFFPIDLTADKAQLNDQDSDWSILRGSTTNIVGDGCLIASRLPTTIYVMNRAIMRWDFTGVPSITITTGKIVLEELSGGSFNMEGYAYSFSNDGELTTSDFANFGSLFSGKGVINAGQMELTLNAAGLAAFQIAITAQAIITIMLRDYRDVEDNAPTDGSESSDIDYNDSYVEFT